MKKSRLTTVVLLAALIAMSAAPTASAGPQRYGTTELVIPLKTPIHIPRLARAVQVPDTPHMRVLVKYLNGDIDLDAPLGPQPVLGPLLIVHLPKPFKLGDYTYTELHLPDTFAVRVLLANYQFNDVETQPGTNE